MKSENESAHEKVLGNAQGIMGGPPGSLCDCTASGLRWMSGKSVFSKMHVCSFFVFN